MKRIKFLSERLKRTGSLITAMTLLITSIAVNNEYFEQISLSAEEIANAEDDVMSAEKAAEIILDNYDMYSDLLISSIYYYYDIKFIDIDFDNRLELMITAKQKQGVSCKIFKINDTNLELLYENSGSFPEDDIYGAYMDENGEKFYLLHAPITPYSNTDKLCFSNGEIKIEKIFYHDESEFKYYDENGNPVSCTEKELGEREDNYYSSLTEMVFLSRDICKFSNTPDDEQFANISYDEQKKSLVDSYNNFCCHEYTENHNVELKKEDIISAIKKYSSIYQSWLLGTLESENITISENTNGEYYISLPYGDITINKLTGYTYWFWVQQGGHFDIYDFLPEIDSSEAFSVNSQNIFSADTSLLNLSFEEVKEKLGMDLSEPKDFPYWGVDLKNTDIVYNGIPVCLMFQYDKLVMIIYDTYSELTNDVFRAAVDAKGEPIESVCWKTENGYFQIYEDYYLDQQIYGYKQNYISSKIINEEPVTTEITETTEITQTTEVIETTEVTQTTEVTETTEITETTTTEKNYKIENVQKYLNQYRDAMNEYIKVLEKASHDDYFAVKNTGNDKDAYLKLMESDRAANGSNSLLTFEFFGISQEEKNAMEDTYEVLFEFLKKSIDAASQKNIISFDIDNSKSLPEIEADMINKIYDSVRKSCKNPDVGTGKHGYTVDLNIYGGIFNMSFGEVTITKDDKKYKAVYCSNMNTVSKTMNLYMNDLCNEVRNQYKNASSSMWNYFLDTSTITSIQTDIMQEKLEDFTDNFIEMGYGNVIKNIKIAKETYDEFSNIMTKNYSSFAEALEGNGDEKNKLLFKAIKGAEITDKDVKDAAVSAALEKLEAARKNAESALYDYIYDANTMETNEKQSWWKIHFSCPVNVDVINNKTGEIVGYVRDGVPYSDGSIEVDCSYDMKTLILPKDGDYSLVLTGTDEGTMQIIYKDIEDGEEQSYITFYDVPLTEGIVYTQQFEASEIHEDTESFSALVSDDGTVINASEYYTAHDENSFVSVTVGTTDGGECYGDGDYIKGDSVLLSAVADKGYQFAGWYEDDILISCQESFRFPAMNDRTITVKYEKIRTENTDYCLLVNEVYKDDTEFWVYNTDNECVDIEISIYVNKTDSSQITAEQNCSDGIKKELTLESTDGVHYSISNVSFNNLKTITFYDAELNQIAVIEKGNIIGDVNGDGETTSSDALNVLQSVVGTADLTEEQKKIADLDGDGEITSADALFILQIVVGLR